MLLLTKSKGHKSNAIRGRSYIGVLSWSEKGIFLLIFSTKEGYLVGQK